jgi:hypothetical protein
MSTMARSNLWAASSERACGGVRGGFHAEAVALEIADERLPDGGLVFDNQQALAH